jgi:hypothetical protein
MSDKKGVGMSLKILIHDYKLVFKAAYVVFHHQVPKPTERHGWLSAHIDRVQIHNTTHEQ